jgi:hypothetical protein
LVSLEGTFNDISFVIIIGHLLEIIVNFFSPLIDFIVWIEDSTDVILIILFCMCMGIAYVAWQQNRGKGPDDEQSPIIAVGSDKDGNTDEKVNISGKCSKCGR